MGPGGFVECQDIKRTSTTGESSGVHREGKRNRRWESAAGGKARAGEDGKNGAGGRRSILSSFHCKCQAQNLPCTSAPAVHLSCNIDCGGRGITIDPSGIFPRPLILLSFSPKPSFTSAVTPPPPSPLLLSPSPSVRVYLSLQSSLADSTSLAQPGCLFVYNLFIGETISAGQFMHSIGTIVVNRRTHLNDRQLSFLRAIEASYAIELLSESPSTSRFFLFYIKRISVLYKKSIDSNFVLHNL